MSVREMGAKLLKPRYAQPALLTRDSSTRAEQILGCSSSVRILSGLTVKVGPSIAEVPIHAKGCEQHESFSSPSL